MSKNKKLQKKQENIAQSIAALTANGVKAFHLKDFDRAIATWEKIPVKLRPAAMLAEAHFRRGLGLFYESDQQLGIADLQAARIYQPEDARLAYHLGLALHRSGDVTGAVSAYQAARQSAGAFAARAAYPLALALLQTGQDATASPAWKDLSAAEQNMLQSASAFRRRPYNLPADAPLLWRALAALDGNDYTQAQSGLEQVLAGEANPSEKALAHYYQGVLAARVENWEMTRRAWNAAAQAKLPSTRLQGNLAELYGRHAENLLTQGNAQGALDAVDEARRHNPDDNALNELAAQIHQQLGYEAANADRWDEAQSHWQTAVKLDDSSFRLAYNLALSYEKSGKTLLAGETWREALRRRPRRTDHPDALSDEQVGRIWQRAAECYRKAGEFEEVGRIYQQAIKWAPDNLNLRMQQADNLINEGRMQAARNELERVLERDPKNVPALLRLGEAYFRDENLPWYNRDGAKKYWEQVLNIDPKNSQAKLLLAEWYTEQGEIAYEWENYPRAIDNYTKSLELNPKNIQTICCLAECHINFNQKARGEEFASQALAMAGGLEDYTSIIAFWVDVNDHERAWEITNQAEARFGKISIVFYIEMAETSLKAREKNAALPWLQRAVEKSEPEDNALLMIAEMTMTIDKTLSREYLQKALQVGQMPGQAHLMLAYLDNQAGDKRASKKHYAEAERFARQSKDEELLGQIEMARLMADGPQALLQRLLETGGPDMVEEFLKDFGNFKEFLDD